MKLSALWGERERLGQLHPIAERRLSHESAIVPLRLGVNGSILELVLLFLVVGGERFDRPSSSVIAGRVSNCAFGPGRYLYVTNDTQVVRGRIRADFPGGLPIQY